MTERKSQFQRRSSILYPILFVLIGLAILPLGVLSWRLIATNQANLRLGQQDLQHSLAKSISQDIENFVSSRETELRIVAEGLGTLRDSAGAEQTKLLSAEGLLDRYRSDLLLDLQVSVPDGPPVRSVGIGHESFELPAVQRDLAEAMAVTGAGRVYTGQPRLLPNFQAVMVVSVPVPSATGTFWVLTGLASLEPIQENLASRSSDVGGYTIYVLDRDLNLFAHSERDKVVQGVDMRQVPLVQSYASNREAPASLTETFEITEGGETRKMLGSRVPLRELGWALFVQTDQRASFQVIRDMIRSAVFWLLVSAAAAAFLAVFFAGRITRPIQELADASHQIALGNFSQRIPVRSSNEIGELADSFNTMTEEIQDYIEQLKRASELNNRIMLGAIRALAAAIDEKDRYTRGHSQRVSHWALQVGARLGLSKSEMRDLEIGSVLHDIGKIGIEDRILKKPDALTPEEFEIMKQHPVKGAHIVAQIEHLREIASMMRHHHERYDGKGYPDRLQGENIPLLARIVTVSDTFDAMTTDRPYQKAMSFRVALAKMIEFKGKALDPKLVDVLVQCFHHGDLGPDPNESGEAGGPELPAAVGAGGKTA